MQQYEELGHPLLKAQQQLRLRLKVCSYTEPFS
jgi:hypothetical protein